MTQRWWISRMTLPAGFVALLSLGGLPGCGKPAASSPAAAPVKAVKVKTEADLTTIELTEQAEKRLGIALVGVERKPVPRTGTYGGEVIVPPGRLVLVSSPFVGILKAPPGPGLPQPGSRVKPGQPVFILVPILSPEARATLAPLLSQAVGQVEQAR